MQLWNRNSFKQIYHTASRKKILIAVFQCNAHCWHLVTSHIKSKIPETRRDASQRELVLEQWWRLSTITRRRCGSVAQCGEDEKGSTLCKCPLTFGTDNPIFRFPCFTAQTCFSLHSTMKKIKMEERLIVMVKGFTFLYRITLTGTWVNGNTLLWKGTTTSKRTWTLGTRYRTSSRQTCPQASGSLDLYSTSVVLWWRATQSETIK